MNFSPTLKKAKFFKRYKRFFADIETEEGPLTIHVPNTGSLKDCLIEGTDCLYTPVNDQKRKLKGTLQFLKVNDGWVGVNTSLPNKLVKEAWENGVMKHWKKFKFLKLEHKINAKTRLDVVLSPSEEDFKNGQNLHFVEIKNVTMSDDQGLALFPDAVTTRGQKHLEELMELQAQGFTTEILFIVQRTDCNRFSPNHHIDPKYAELLKKAVTAGVRVSVYPCSIDPAEGVKIVDSALEVEL